jgi:uncharacterized protein DUF5077
VSDAVAKENSAIEIIKSAFVIPLVIALVMGTGWELVRWAALRKAESGKADPRPAVSGPDGSLTLQLPFAQIGGELRHRDSGLVNWQRTDDTVAWRFNVEKPGRYAVELDCACDSADAGSVVRVDLDAETFQVTIPNTGGNLTFKTVRAGQVDLPSAGWRGLRIVPVTVAHNSVMILRGVRLVPLETSSIKR